MELRTLKTFQTVAQLHSFSKAALQLGYTQAAITIQIKQLETELQVKLFDRFNKNTVLTKKGELFYQHACQILEEEKKARLAMMDTPILNGTLKIGLTESLSASLFPKILAAFHQEYPAVKIVIETASPEYLLDRMHQNFLDIVYFIDCKKHHKNWIKCLEEAEDIVFVTNAKHPLVKQKNIVLNDILKQEIILTEKAVSYRNSLDQYALSQGIEIEPYLEIGNTDFIIQQLLTSNTISFLPRFCIHKYVESNTLAILSPSDFTLSTWRQVVYHKNKWVTPEMEAFLPYITTNSMLPQE